MKAFDVGGVVMEVVGGGGGWGGRDHLALMRLTDLDTERFLNPKTFGFYYTYHHHSQGFEGNLYIEVETKGQK